MISFTQEDWDKNDPDFNPNYPTTSANYRGVVSIDIGDGDAAHELICDFGTSGLGIWLYDNELGWRRLTSNDPEWIIGIQLTPGDHEIVGCFQLHGVWLWDYPGGWSRLTSDVPGGSLCAVDDDGDGIDELHADFSEIGLWRYGYDSKAWMQLTSQNIARLAIRSDSWRRGIEEFSLCF